MLAAGSTVHAQLHWDVNGTNPGATDSNSAGGTWTDASWTTDAAGLAAPGAFVSGSAVIFSAGTNATGSSTITVPTSQTIGGFTVEEGIVALTGAGAVVNGANPVRINNGATLSVFTSASFSTTAGSVVTFDGGTLRTTLTSISGNSFWDADSVWELTSNGGTVDVSATDIPAASAASSAGAPAGGGAGRIADGSTDPMAIIRAAGCTGCHKINGEGGAIGPDLNHVGGRLSTALIRESILMPDAKIARGFEKFKGIMPKTFGEQLTAAQLESLVQFLGNHK
jgi:hypothetical protein